MHNETETTKQAIEYVKSCGHDQHVAEGFVSDFGAGEMLRQKQEKRMIEALMEIASRDPAGEKCGDGCSCIGCIARSALGTATEAELDSILMRKPNGGIE